MKKFITALVLLTTGQSFAENLSALVAESMVLPLNITFVNASKPCIGTILNDHTVITAASCSLLNGKQHTEDITLMPQNNSTPVKAAVSLVPKRWNNMLQYIGEHLDDGSGLSQFNIGIVFSQSILPVTGQNNMPIIGFGYNSPPQLRTYGLKDGKIYHIPVSIAKSSGNSEFIEVKVPKDSNQYIIDGSPLFDCINGEYPLCNILAVRGGEASNCNPNEDFCTVKYTSLLNSTIIDWVMQLLTPAYYDGYIYKYNHSVASYTIFMPVE